MSRNISVVINTLNEEKNIERAVRSVKWADEVLVCDMHSEDQTVAIAKKMGAKVITHERTGYVEPARNFAISKANGDWILILDADEEIPTTLVEKLKDIVQEEKVNFVEIPRKNIIFGNWMKASGWWPDYNIRFFKKGSVEWSDKIHSKPKTSGEGLTLPAEESLVIIHYHYESVWQFVERLNRYTTIQAEELHRDGYKFVWTDLVTKPVNEFLSRYFANRGFEDGLHGLSLAFLQAFSFLIMYLKIWEMEKFSKQDIGMGELKQVSIKAKKDIDYWFKYSSLSRNPLIRTVQKVRNKLR